MWKILVFPVLRFRNVSPFCWCGASGNPVVNKPVSLRASNRSLLTPQAQMLVNYQEDYSRWTRVTTFKNSHRYQWVLSKYINVLECSYYTETERSLGSSAHKELSSNLFHVIGFKVYLLCLWSLGPMISKKVFYFFLNYQN